MKNKFTGWLIRKYCNYEQKNYRFCLTFPGQDGDSQDQSKSGQESKNRIEETLHTARFIKPY